MRLLRELCRTFLCCCVLLKFWRFMSPLCGVVVLCCLHSSFTFLNHTHHNQTKMNTTTNPTSPPARLPSQAKRAAANDLLQEDARHKSDATPATPTLSFLLVLPRSWGRPHTKWQMWDATRGGWERSWYRLKDDKTTLQPETGLKRVAKAQRIGKKWWQW